MFLTAAACGSETAPGAGEDLGVPVVEWRLGELPSRVELNSQIRLSAERWDGEWREIPGTELRWSSDDEIVDLEGNQAQFIGVGDVEISASFQQESKSVSIEVFRGQEIQILPESGAIAPGATFQFDLQVEGQSVAGTWEVVSGNAAGSVDETGVLTANSEGEVELRACFAAECAARTVHVIPIDDLEILPELDVVRVGVPTDLEVIAYDSNGDQLLAIPDPEWTAVNAQIDEAGVLSVEAPGQGTVRVDVGGMGYSSDFEIRLFISDFTCNGVTCCAIDIRGQAFCMGDGDYMGNGQFEAQSTNYLIPVDTELRFSEWIGDNAFCGRLRDSDEIACWGRGAKASVGLGEAGDLWVPTIVPWTFDSVVFGSPNCALNSQGELYCWGYVYSGEEGGWGTYVPRSLFLKDSGPFVDIRGTSRVCVKDLAEVWSCFGDNDEGALGVPVYPMAPDAPSNYYHELVEPQVEVDVIDIHSASSSTCATDLFGLVRCWGRNHRLMLGDPDLSPLEISSPVRTQWSTKFDSLFGMGDSHCGVRSDDQMVYCWGAGLLEGVSEYSADPVLLPVQEGVKKYVPSSFALMEDGDVLAWGFDWRRYRPGDGSVPQEVMNQNRTMEPYLIPQSIEGVIPPE